MCTGIVHIFKCPCCGGVVDKLKDACPGWTCREAQKHCKRGICRTGIEWAQYDKPADEMCIMCELRLEGVVAKMTVETCPEGGQPWPEDRAEAEGVWKEFVEELDGEDKTEAECVWQKYMAALEKAAYVDCEFEHSDSEDESEEDERPRATSKVNIKFNLPWSKESVLAATSWKAKIEAMEKRGGRGSTSSGPRPTTQADRNHASSRPQRDNNSDWTRDGTVVSDMDWQFQSTRRINTGATITNIHRVGGPFGIPSPTDASYSDRHNDPSRRSMMPVTTWLSRQPGGMDTPGRNQSATWPRATGAVDPTTTYAGTRAQARRVRPGKTTYGPSSWNNTAARSTTAGPSNTRPRSSTAAAGAPSRAAGLICCGLGRTGGGGSVDDWSTTTSESSDDDDSSLSVGGGARVR
ncbi:hypothetical protein F5Y16DRAFT_354536 [Xylariaceae sp. FL0255]|nr:hypothetical protein F5Y16DRAFT_354536 [Xylariaceae sp. FL0255]